MKLLRLIVGIGGLLGCAAASAGVGVWSGQGPFGGYVYDVLQAAASPSTLYVSTRSGIFKSIDAGASWAPAMNGIVGSVSYGYPLALDADVSNTLYAADSTGHLYRTSDGAANWLQTGYVLAPLALGVPQIIQITDSPGSTTRIYVVTYASGVLVSNDSGATFSARNGSGGSSLPAGIPLQTIAVDPADANNLLAGTAYDDLGLGPDVPSLYRSTDAGATWTGVVTLAGGGDSYYGSVTDISFGNGSEVYANIDGTIYRSANSGGTWAPASGSPNYLTTVQADPALANSVYAGGYFGLMHSSDGGTTFTSVAGAANGLTPNGSDVATVSRLVRSGANWLIATQEAGIFRSSNFGSSWTGSNNGLDATNIRALGMIPASPAPRILAGYGDAFRPSPG
ncbi:MAG: hypothetical protein ABIQ78_03505, partial [Dokdonella sp.]